MDIEKSIKESLAEAQYYVAFIQSEADFFQSDNVKELLALPIEDLRENLNQVHQIASALPRLFNAVDAGEDEETDRTK
jgi:hypothetical protein